MAAVEKKSAVRERHHRAAIKFQRWSKSHPEAPLDEKVKRFDTICDIEAAKK